MVALSEPAMSREMVEMCERLANSIIEKTEAHSLMETLGLEHMDLVAEGIKGAVKAWPKFDPSRKLQPQTFLHNPIRAGIFDYLRKEGSQSRRIKGLAGLTPKADKNRDLCDWLADVYQAATKTYIDARCRARRTYPMPQTIAIASLMRHGKGMSCRETARFLAKRDDVRAVLKMGRVPHWRSLANARALLDRMTGFHTAQNAPEMA